MNYFRLATVFLLLTTVLPKANQRLKFWTTTMLDYVKDLKVRQKRFDGAFQIYVTDSDGYVIK